MGYLNNEEKSKESLDESGWLHTGDIGKIDKVGTAKCEKSFHFHGHTLGFHRLKFRTSLYSVLNTVQDGSNIVRH